jgi:hypothetical protein
MPVTVFIGTPGDQEVITGSSFEASGNVSPPGARMAARLRDAAARETEGEMVSPRPGYDWTFRFSAISRDEPLTLSVRGEDPVTQERGEAARTIRCVRSGASNPDFMSASFEAPHQALGSAGNQAEPAHRFVPLPGEIAETEVAEPPVDEIAPAALPPITTEPAQAATGELPEEARIEESGTRRRPRPVARKKPAARAAKSGRVPPGRRAKASPAKAARAPAARRGRGPAKKAAAMNRKAPKKAAAKAGKSATKKASKTAPKKSVKAKTGKVAGSAARRGTKPTARKASKAVAKTNPKKRHSR